MQTWQASDDEILAEVLNSERRFWNLVDIQGADECWNWKATTSSGYGGFRIGKNNLTRRTEGAHRMSWMISNRKVIPHGMFICHRCDNKLCVNPAHLFLGTSGDNVRDMTAKGRHWLHDVERRKQLNGEGNAHCQHTEAEVLTIYNLYRSGVKHPEIARLLEMPVMYVYNILRGKTWKYLYKKEGMVWQSKRG